jgi:hypothetical protein
MLNERIMDLIVNQLGIVILVTFFEVMYAF